MAGTGTQKNVHAYKAVVKRRMHHAGHLVYRTLWRYESPQDEAAARWTITCEACGKSVAIGHDGMGWYMRDFPGLCTKERQRREIGKELDK